MFFSIHGRILYICPSYSSSLTSLTIKTVQKTPNSNPQRESNCSDHEAIPLNLMSCARCCRFRRRCRCPTQALCDGPDGCEGDETQPMRERIRVVTGDGASASSRIGPALAPVRRMVPLSPRPPHSRRSTKCRRHVPALQYRRVNLFSTRKRLAVSGRF
jgi:hypothetical protein